MTNGKWKMLRPAIAAAKVRVMAMRHFDRNARAFAFTGGDDSLAAERACPPMQAHQPIAFAHPVRVKPFPVVGDDQHQPPAIYPQLDFRPPALSVADDVVDGFLEDQEDLAAEVGSKLQVRPCGRSMKT